MAPATVQDLLFRHAHTTYAFTDEPVLDELLAEIYDLMRLGPTAMNSQPLRVVFIRTAAGKARLLPHLAEGNRPKSASAPVVAILAADADYHLHLDRFAPHQKGARERLAANPETRLKDATFNATLQAGYFILAARAVGLDAGPMGGFDRAGIDAEFFDGTAVHSILVVNLGHAAEDGQRARAPRLELLEAVTFA